MPPWLCPTTDLPITVLVHLGCYVVCTAVASVCLFPECVPADFLASLHGLSPSLQGEGQCTCSIIIYARVHDGIDPS